MKTFKIEKKRDGQDWKELGSFIETDFDSAKKHFAQLCETDLLNGVHGDNFVYKDEESIKEIEGDTSWFIGDGVYFEQELFLSSEDVEAGIEFFSEDVYSYRVVEL